MIDEKTDVTNSDIKKKIFFFMLHGINFIIKKKTIKIPNIGRFGIEIQFSKIKPTIHCSKQNIKKTHTAR